MQVADNQSGGTVIKDDSLKLLQLSTTSFLLFASASLMTGDYDTARLVADLVLNTPGSHYSHLDTYEHITLQGILATMRVIKRLAENPSTMPQSLDFDPITHPE